MMPVASVCAIWLQTDKLSGEGGPPRLLRFQNIPANTQRTAQNASVPVRLTMAQPKERPVLAARFSSESGNGLTV
jgi:hypothetical protein